MLADCHVATNPLTGGWRLFYFETKRWHHEKQIHINASQPFRKAYTSPMPMYLSTISVCDATANYCHTSSSSALEPDESCDEDVIK